MKKRILLGLTLLMATTSAFAGGLLTNTNQSASYVRNPSRDAAIAIDAVYYNPAGVAFLEKGFHLSLNYQAAWQKRQITSNSPLFTNNTNNATADRYFEGKAVAPAIPSVQFAYVINDKWSFAAQFSVVGGGGTCEFENGLSMFEGMIAGQAFNSDGLPSKNYTINQSLTGKQIIYGLQVGATYKIIDNLSVFAGVRGVYASMGYEGAMNGITIAGMDSNRFAQMAQAAYTSGDMATYAKLATAAGATSDYVLDCNQKSFGVTPILGIDFKYKNWNFAAKYEFRTKLNLKNNSTNSSNVDMLMPEYKDGAYVRSDIPALFTVGVEYSPIECVRISGGFHHYHDKAAKGAATEVDKNTIEGLFGIEWDAHKVVTLSAGMQRTKYGFSDTQIKDTNFNLDSWCLGVGAQFNCTDFMKVNVGYFHSFYQDRDVADANGVPTLTNNYNRKNDLIGASLDFKF